MYNSPVLETERKFLDSHRDKLLKAYGGKFLVISGEQVSGAFDTIDEALGASVAKHGLNNVLIRRPAEAQLEISIPALTLGLLNANPTRTDSGSGNESGR